MVTSRTISPLGYSWSSTLIWGWRLRNGQRRSGRNSVSAAVLQSSLTCALTPLACSPSAPRISATCRKIVRACWTRVSPAAVGSMPCRIRSSSDVPRSSSIPRIRALAAANAKWARSAPAVMLPASTTCRNRRRSVMSKRIAPPDAHNVVIKASDYTKLSLKYPALTG